MQLTSRTFLSESCNIQVRLWNSTVCDYFSMGFVMQQSITSYGFAFQGVNSYNVFMCFLFSKMVLMIRRFNFLELLRTWFLRTFRSSPFDLDMSSNFFSATDFSLWYSFGKKIDSCEVLRKVKFHCNFLRN